MSKPESESMKPVDKGNVSLFNAVLICVFMMGVAYNGTSMYDSLKLGQDKELAALDAHGTDIEQIRKDMTAMHARSVAVYPTRWDLNEEGITWKAFAADNPTLKIPNVYEIHIQNPPQVPPTP